jgi:hypothetical protein
VIESIANGDFQKVSSTRKLAVGGLISSCSMMNGATQIKAGMGSVTTGSMAATLACASTGS